MFTKFFFNDYLVLFPWDVREADVKWLGGGGGELQAQLFLASPLRKKKPVSLMVQKIKLQG